jgi:hypothetical protein
MRLHHRDSRSVDPGRQPTFRTESAVRRTVVLTFDEIEKIIGDKLPPAALKSRVSLWLKIGWTVWLTPCSLL